MGERDYKAEVLALRAANVALLDRAEAAESWGVPDYHRICLNCGKKLTKDTKRMDNPCGDKSPEGYSACTFDMTYMELVERCKFLEKEILTVRRANQILQAESEQQQESNTTH